MPMASEDERQGRPIKTTREPKGPAKATGPGSMGDQALQDAMIILVACWLILIMLMFSLRRYNV